MIKILLLIGFAFILAVFTILGFKNGFIKTLVSMSALIIALICVFLFAEKITAFIDEHTSLRESSGERIEAILEKIFEDDNAATDAEQKEAVEHSWIPQSLIKLVEEEKETASAVYAKDLAIKLTDLVMKGAGILVTLLVVFIIVRLLLVLSGILRKLPIVGGLNGILGAALGFARGLIIIWIICFVITMLAHTELGQSALTAISESKVLSLFYDGTLSFGSVIG